MKFHWVTVVAVAGLATAGGAWHELQRRPDRTAEARLFERVVTTIRREHVDSVGDELYGTAARAVVASLDDPYSELLAGESYDHYRRTVTGEEVVVGDASRAARRGGIAPGDEVLAIDGRSTAGWTRAEIARALEGPVGSSVTVVVRPRGAEVAVRRTLTRTTMHVPATSAGLMLGNEIGYLALRVVSEGSADELRRSLEQLAGRGMRALVLDLRGNPGGLIREGVEIAGLFLPLGDTVGTARGRSAAHTRTYLVTDHPDWPSLPLVLLVDGTTASAAELIAGALQDHDRAILAGTPSFGKGVLQTTYPLEDDVALKITTARWFTPSGRSIQRTPADSLDEADAAGTRQFRSAAGRPLPDSSGVVPDVRVAPGPRLAGERTVRRAVGSDLELFRAVIADHVSEVLRESSGIAPATPVTPAQRERLRQRLLAEGIEIAPGDFEAAAPYVDREVRLELVRQALGDDREAAQRALADRQVRAATRLLRGADDPGDVFRAAGVTLRPSVRAPATR